MEDTKLNAETTVVEDKLAEYVADSLKWKMCKDVLIKPLEPIMVKKEFSTPVVSDKVKEDGEDIQEYNEVATEIKEVESNFARGVVLTLPTITTDWQFKVGDIVIFNKKFSVEFDIFKNSILVKPYDIIAIEK